MTRLKDLKKRPMEDPEFREEYARADDEFRLKEALIRARIAAKLTQAELARCLGTTQSTIAAGPGRKRPKTAAWCRYPCQPRRAPAKLNQKKVACRD